MADQAAGLTLKVDASQVKAANVELDNLGRTSESTERKVKKFNDENKKTGQGSEEAERNLRKQSSAVDSVGNAMTKNQRIAQQLGMTTNNLSFASKNAAFQLQDVFVSLEMGMPVTRVMIQQLPQLTGAFGGLGNTLRYVGAMLGPIGLAITAVTATLGVGAAVISRSERQISDLNKTLTLTGNISGLTADKIITLSENAEAAGKSFNKTRDTIQLLAGAGVKAGADFEKLADTVGNFAKASGEPIEDVVASIAKLSTDPVGGLQALADKYHVVTQAQVESVRVLVEQGRETEAVAQANAAATASFAKMASEIKGNAGTLERAFNAVTGAAKGMWDAILDVGRPASANKQEMEVREQLQQRVTAYNAEMNAINKQNGQATEAQKARLSVLNQEIDSLTSQLSTFTKVAQGKRDEAKAREEAAIAQERENDNAKIAADYAQRYATNAEKRSQALTKLKNDLDKGAISQAQYLEYEKRINETMKDPAAPKAAAVRVDAGLKMAEAARAELAALIESGKQITANASEQTRTMRAQAELNKLNAAYAETVTAAKTRTLTVAEKQTLAEYKTTKAVREQIVEEAKRQDALEKSVKAHQQVDLYLKNQNAEIKAVTESYALSTREARNLREEMQLIDRLQRAGANTSDIDAAVNKLREAQVATRGENATLFQGFSSGLADMVDETGTAYSQMKDLTGFTFSAMTDTMSEFFMTGKLGAKEMVTSILAELVKLATSQAFISIIKAFGFGGGTGGLMGSLFGAIANANGGAYSGGNLSMYSGQVVTQPTYFNYGVKAFANGAGLMGEAGPEAIMPLKRGPDGKLGVASSGGAGGIFVETNVNMAAGTSTTTTSGIGDPRTAQAFGKQISEAVKAEIVNQQKPGGSLYKR